MKILLSVIVLFGVITTFFFIPQTQVYTQRALAHLGHNESKAKMAIRYINGTGVEKDADKASYWLSRVEKPSMGDLSKEDKQFYIDLREIHGIDDIENLEQEFVELVNGAYEKPSTAISTGFVDFILLKAIAGDVEAQALLGAMYRDGRWVQQDDKQALEWFKLAADQGHAAALYSIGWYKMQGQILPQDIEEGIQDWNKAKKIIRN